MPGKNSKVKLGLKNLAMLPSYFDYIFVHLRQKARFRPELSLKFLSTLGPNPHLTKKAWPNLQLGYLLPQKKEKNDGLESGMKEGRRREKSVGEKERTGGCETPQQ